MGGKLGNRMEVSLGKGSVGNNQLFTRGTEFSALVSEWSVTSGADSFQSELHNVYSSACSSLTALRRLSAPPNLPMISLTLPRLEMGGTPGKDEC